MKVVGIIVTYANRYKHVQKVISALLCQGVYRIIIVNNNSAIESFNYYENISKNDKILIINLKKNTGTAFAFNRGIEKALEDNESEFIWLLDDDNLPSKNALNEVQKEYKNLGGYKLIIAPVRKDKEIYRKAVVENLPYLTLGSKNIFRAFNIADFFIKQNRLINNERTCGEVHALPYGGMFFHKSILSGKDLLNEDYVLYSDDTEFCCRHRGYGGKIYCLLTCYIDDLEESWYANSFAPYNFATSKSLIKEYYIIRNRIAIEKKYLVSS
jgi:GT2 family glycosyltransferase